MNLVNPVFAEDVSRVYVLSLAVNDGRVSSDTLTAAVTAYALNLPPVANAGPEQIVMAGAVVTLDGSASSDADGYFDVPMVIDDSAERLDCGFDESDHCRADSHARPGGFLCGQL